MMSFAYCKHVSARTVLDCVLSFQEYLSSQQNYPSQFETVLGGLLPYIRYIGMCRPIG